MSWTVAVIPGGDAGPRVDGRHVGVLEAMDLGIVWARPPVGDAAVAEHGSRFPAQARSILDAADASLLGATSGASGAALRYLRWGKETFANVRPTRYRAGFTSPLSDLAGIDFVIVPREP
jgi:isocitrate/isopropylmalate dehydrogenase